jgi:hypothetical protein
VHKAAKRLFIDRMQIRANSSRGGDGSGERPIDVERPAAQLSDPNRSDNTDTGNDAQRILTGRGPSSIDVGESRLADARDGSRSPIDCIADPSTHLADPLVVSQAALLGRVVSSVTECIAQLVPNATDVACEVARILHATLKSRDAHNTDDNSTLLSAAELKHCETEDALVTRAGLSFSRDEGGCRFIT